jgi:medium-chain acyl-[acyl-carrier-protein] hydrolase
MCTLIILKGEDSMEGSIYEKEYDVHHYEVDASGRIFVASIMNYLDDLAVSQAEYLNIGIEYLLTNKIAWVIYKWDVKFNKFAKGTDKLKIRTMPYSVRKFYAYRKYEVINSEGEVIVSANSLWFLINTEKRRPTKISEEIATKFGLRLDDKKQIEFERLKKPENITTEKEFQVRYSDIDTNQHVNNVRYITWALEAVPKDLLSNYTLKQLKINYEKETAYGEVIKVLCEVKKVDDKYIVISSVQNSEGEKLTLVKMVWSK